MDCPHINHRSTRGRVQTARLGAPFLRGLDPYRYAIDIHKGCLKGCRLSHPMRVYRGGSSHPSEGVRGSRLYLGGVIVPVLLASHPINGRRLADPVRQTRPKKLKVFDQIPWMLREGVLGFVSESVWNRHHHHIIPTLLTSHKNHQTC